MSTENEKLLFLKVIITYDFGFKSLSAVIEKALAIYPDWGEWGEAFMPETTRLLPEQTRLPKVPDSVNK